MTHNELIDDLKELIREWNSNAMQESESLFTDGQNNGLLMCANDLHQILDDFLSTPTFKIEPPLLTQEELDHADD